MDLIFLLIFLWIILALVMIGLWKNQEKYQNAGIADVGWAYGLVCSAIYFSIQGNGDESRRVLMAFLASIWGIRLGTYLLVDRIFRASEEDGRYQNLRNYYGEKAKRGFFWFFQVQALFVVIFSIPFLVVSWNPHPSFTNWDAIGILIWIGANIGEWVADKQLTRFRSDKKNKFNVCQNGLWRYSRHPNYFFEWLHWWSYVLLSVGSPVSWISLIGPITMGFLLFKVTGIPYTELQALKRRGTAYRIYQETTSPFIPWFPKEISK